MPATLAIKFPWVNTTPFQKRNNMLRKKKKKRQRAWLINKIGGNPRVNTSPAGSKKQEFKKHECATYGVPEEPLV